MLLATAVASGSRKRLGTISRQVVPAWRFPPFRGGTT